MSQVNVDTDTPSTADFSITETITVPDRDLSPTEMAKIMKQVSRVCNFLGSLIMKHAAHNSDMRSAGAGHPIAQNIIGCAAQADAAVVSLSGPSQIMSPNHGGTVPAPARRTH
jgi:hypothetical protein